MSDSLMNLSGALGGAVAGSIMAALMFVGLNLSAMAPVSLILIFTGLTLLRGRRENASKTATELENPTTPYM
jgi:hypothetical protein